MQNKTSLQTNLKTIRKLSILYLYFENDIYNIHPINTQRANLEYVSKKIQDMILKHFILPQFL